MWLFSVSPVGDVGSFLAPPVARVMRRARGESKDIAELRTLVDVRDHRNFAGAIERGHWSTAGHVFFRLVGGTYGDHRQWDDIDRWTDRIATACPPNRRMNRHVGFPDGAGSASAASGPKRPPGEPPPGGPSWPATRHEALGAPWLSRRLV